EFEVEDRVLLKVTPWKGVVHFGKKGKLAPRYVGPFEILERIGLVAYRLRLLEELNSVHDTFHVSNLKKCLADANLHVPLNEIKIDKTLRFAQICRIFLDGDGVLDVRVSFLHISLFKLQNAFDVIVGMDWLSQNKAVIVCHEKVVEIPLIGDELKVGDISVMRDFVDVFSEDLSRLSPHRQVEFCIDLILGATPGSEVFISLATSEIKNCRKLQRVAKTRKEKLYDKFTKSEAVRIGKYLRHHPEILIILRLAEREEAFQTLKNNLCDAPILSLPDVVEDFVVYCDASNQGFRRVILPPKKNGDLTSLQTHIDLKGVKYAPKEVIELFSDYECEIRYHPGKSNVVADALSRKERVKPKRVRAMAMGLFKSGMNGKEMNVFTFSRRYEKHAIMEMTDKVVVIKEKLKAARDRQKSYANNRRKSLEFEVGDRVMLKVSPWKSMVRFGKKGKLAPRYVEPFEIPERISPIAYRLRLPEELIGVHDTFYVLNLKKCLRNANFHVPLNEIKIDRLYVLLRKCKKNYG
ncbi:putative reverse transcriptase domain-containing protein, partial [Tanacetum coccineum]